MAKKARNELLTLDAHNDSIILREVRGDPLDFADADPAYHADLPRMRKGGMGALFVMVGDSDMLQSLRLIDSVYRMCADHPKDFALCLNAREVTSAMKAGRIALVMSIEGQAMFAQRIENLRNWRRLGVRIASLTHGEGKCFGAPNALQLDQSFFGFISPQDRTVLRRHSKGLSPFGREALKTMAELQLPCDVAHVNDVVFWQVLEHAQAPVCYTHGACYSISPHARNLTDEMMKGLAARDGVMGICFFRDFIDAKTPTVDRLVDHFLHALEIMGEDHVGIGSDFDGVPLHQTPVIPDAGHLPELWEALEKKGLSRATLEKLAHRNFLRLLG